MTAPVPDDESLAFEAAAVQAVTGSISSGLDELIAAVLAAFEAAIRAGNVEQAGRVIGERIKAVTWEPIQPKLINLSTEAIRTGIMHEVRTMPRGKRRTTAETNTYPIRPRKVPDSDTALRKTLAEADRLSKKVKNRSDARKVVGRIKSGKARIEGHARQVANEGLNAGTAEVAKALGENLMWIPERDACLDCLAHAGWVVEPDALFPAVSFDPKAKGVLAVPFPPLHPNCRCRARSVGLPAGKPTGSRSSTSPADALAREARRTVVYQWTDHASRVAAERAAEALLSAGADLPSTVVQRARRALRKGGYRRPR